MVKFNELKITQNGEFLIIDVSIEDLPYYDNVYLESVIIDTQDTFLESGPSTEGKIVLMEGNNIKSYRIELNKKDLLPSLKDNLFFIYVTTKGTPSVDTPSGMDSAVTLGITYCKETIQNYVLQCVRNVGKDCSIPKKFANTFLQYKAFEMSIATGKNTQAIYYYNKCIKDINISNLDTSNCTCYG